MCDYNQGEGERYPYHNHGDTHQSKQLATLIVMFASDFDGSPSEFVHILCRAYRWISTTAPEPRSYASSLPVSFASSPASFASSLRSKRLDN